MIENGSPVLRWCFALAFLLSCIFGTHVTASTELTIELDSDELFQGEPISGYFDVSGELPQTFCNAIQFYGGCLSYELVQPDGASRIIDCMAIDFCVGACGDGFRLCPAGRAIRVPLFLWFIDRTPLLDMPGGYRLQVKIEHDGEEVVGAVEFEVFTHPEFAGFRDGFANLYAEFFVQAFDAGVTVVAKNFKLPSLANPYDDLLNVVVPFFSISGRGVSYVLNYGTIEPMEGPYPENATAYDLAKLRVVKNRYSIILAYIERFEAARDGTPCSVAEDVRYVLCTL